MIREGRVFGFALCLLLAPLASAGDNSRHRTVAAPAPMEIPHAAKIEAEARAAKSARREISRFRSSWT